MAILSENRVEWALTDYALLGLGAIPVPIYTTLLEPDIEYILRDSGAKGIVVATEAQLAKIVNVRPRLAGLEIRPGHGLRQAGRNRRGRVGRAASRWKWVW